MTTILDFPGIRQLLSREPAFVWRLKQIATSLSLDYNAMAGVMGLESGFKPEAVNPSGGASGLIQFMPATAKALGTSIEAIRSMTGTEQLEWVEKFFRPHAGRLTRLGDYYMAVFMPGYLGAPRETVLGELGSTEILPKTNLTKGRIYEQNKGLDIDRDGKLTVGDVMSKLERFVQNASTKPALEVAEVPLAGGSSLPAPGSVAPPPSLSPAWRSAGGPFDLPVLRIGARGSAVAMAQVLLGCDVVTGVYTEAMAVDYVRPFQSKRGLHPDGVIGRVTWSELVIR